MDRVTKKFNVYLNTNKVDEVTMIKYLEQYDGSISALFKKTLRSYIEQHPSQIMNSVNVKPKTIVATKEKPNKLLDTFTL